MFLQLEGSIFPYAMGFSRIKITDLNALKRMNILLTTFARNCADSSENFPNKGKHGRDIPRYKLSTQDILNKR